MNRMSRIAVIESCRSPLPRWARSAAIVVASVVMQCPLAAEIAERPDWKIGDKWLYHSRTDRPPSESDWSREVKAVLPDSMVNAAGVAKSAKYGVVTETGQTLAFDAETNSLDSRGADFTWRRFSFPLTLGKRWTHERKIENKNTQINGNETSTWVVSAYERITVPAGSYDCYRTVGTAYRAARSETSIGFSRWTTRIVTTYWFCPEVKWVAKWRVETDSAGVFSRVDTSELTAFEHN
jgi:hypothetical protein